MIKSSSSREVFETKIIFQTNYYGLHGCYQVSSAFLCTPPCLLMFHMSDSVRGSSVDTGPVHFACNPLPMLTRHQPLIEVHVRRKGQFAAVPFSAHQGLKVSRYHIGTAPYVFAQKKSRTFRLFFLRRVVVIKAMVSRVVVCNVYAILFLRLVSEAC